MSIYFKLRDSSDNDNISIVNTLMIGTAENRLRVPVDDCDDMPNLLNDDGTIYDETYSTTNTGKTRNRH